MRILFVAMANSIHTARWVSQLYGQGWDIHLFPATDKHVHPRLHDLTLHDFLRYATSELKHRNIHVAGAWRFPRGGNLAKQAVRRLASSTWGDRAWRLARAIEKLQPDVVHSLEMQHAGYLTLAARQHLDGGLPPWIYSSWGSDLFLFGWRGEHQERTRAVLATCDYYIADCRRDVRIARELGFSGEVLGVFPGPGGFDVQRMHGLGTIDPTSSRRAIALEGRHDDEAMRGLVGLQALDMCSDALVEYEVVIYSAQPNVQSAAEQLAQTAGLDINILPPSSLSERPLPSECDLW